MANAFLKPTVIINTALGLLYREIVLPSLVWTDAVPDFAGALNDTVSLRVPGRLTARSRAMRGTGGARTITMDNLTDTKVDVTLSTDLYSAVPVTDEELTLDIVDFAGRILAPSIRAVAEGIENSLVATMQDATYATVINVATTAATSNVYNAAVDARKALNDANVPLSNRRLVIGSAIEASILKDPLFVQAQQSGSTDARTDALIGRIAGFDVFTSNALNPEEGYAFHSSAFILAVRAPSIPAGVAFGASESFQGMALRWIRDYDFANVQDRSLVDAFCGSAIVPDGASFVRAVKLELAAATLAITGAATTYANSSAAPGQIIVTATYADGKTQVVTLQATYVSATPAHATVSATGLVTPVAAGTSVVTVSFAGVSATQTYTVTA